MNGSGLQRRLGMADFTLITIGSIIGSGIFRNPAVVAQRAHAPLLIMLSWIAGGILAMIGAFVFAELASRRPETGGLYAYLRDAFGPGLGFVYVWMDFWVMYSGGTAASAALFAGYVVPAFGIHLDPRIVSVAAIACVTFINLLGVRPGTGWQNLLVILKLSAVCALIVAGFAAHPLPPQPELSGFGSSVQLAGAFGVALLPALFAYLGFQAAAYIAGEVRNPAHNVSRGLVAGVGVVTVVYVLVSAGCLRVLGAPGLAATTTPAADVMNAFLGPLGGRIIAIAVGLSTLGYMSTSLLVAPRVYFQLAEDGMLFPQAAWVHPRTRVPVIAIVMYGAVSALLAASGTFAQIINWVTVPVWIFIALGGCALFVFRRRDAGLPAPVVRVPGHPWSTLLLIAAVAGVVVAEIAVYPRDTIYALLVAVAGAAAYAVFVRRNARTA